MSSKPEILYDHESLNDLKAELFAGADSVEIFTYLIGVNAPLAALYRQLEGINHEIYVGWARDQRAYAHSCCTDVLVTQPKLKLFLLQHQHSKLWHIRRKKDHIYYVGSYNLSPTNSGQIMVKLRGGSPIVINRAGAARVTFNNKDIFSGIPFSSKPSLLD